MTNIREDSFTSDEDFDDEEGSESSSDVDAKLAEDEVFDAEFLKCYSALKKKDEKIYDKNVRFFDEKESSDSSDEANGKDKEDAGNDNKAKKAPKMTLLDLQLKGAKDGILEEQLENPKIDLNQQISKSYYEKELEEIKKSIEKVGEEIGSESDDDLLVIKSSAKNEIKPKPKNEINILLDRMVYEEDEDINHLKQVWSDPKNLSAEDKYLRDYILNKRYLPKNVNQDADDDGKADHFSKNIDELSDLDEDDESEKDETQVAIHRSDEKDFDKIARIPRNSTKTIRDIVEKREKREKRAKKLEKEKKKKQAITNVDCEDVIGDLPTRFHYRKTEPNDFGLTAEELLMATDEELDQWVNLKECVAYKSREEELAQKQKFESMRSNMELKRKIFRSIYEDGSQSLEGETARDGEKETRSKNKKRKRNADSESSLNPLKSSDRKPVLDQPTVEEQKRNKKKRKKRGLNHKKFAKVGVAPDRLLAYGLSKTKLKKTKLL